MGFMNVIVTYEPWTVLLLIFGNKYQSFRTQSRLPQYSGYGYTS